MYCVCALGCVCLCACRGLCERERGTDRDREGGESPSVQLLKREDPMGPEQCGQSSVVWRDVAQHAAVMKFLIIKVCLQPRCISKDKEMERHSCIQTKAGLGSFCSVSLNWNSHFPTSRLHIIRVLKL